MSAHQASPFAWATLEQRHAVASCLRVERDSDHVVVLPLETSGVGVAGASFGQVGARDRFASFFRHQAFKQGEQYLCAAH